MLLWSRLECEWSFCFPLVTATAYQVLVESHLDYWKNVNPSPPPINYPLFKILSAKTFLLLSLIERPLTLRCMLTAASCPEEFAHLCWRTADVHVCAFLSAVDSRRGIATFCPLGGPGCLWVLPNFNGQECDSCRQPSEVFTNTSNIGNADVLPLFPLLFLICFASLFFSMLLKLFACWCYR